MSAVTQTVVEIQAIELLRGYVLRLQFSDGKTIDVDFEPFLKQSQHPGIRKYLDAALFKTYRLEHGDLMWGDFDLCFPIADLYEGHL